MGAGWGVRAIRAAVFASVCVLLAALGHTLMSGAAVPWWTLLAGLLATCGVGWCLAGRERGLPLVVSVVVVTQGALHAVFELAQGVGVGGASADMGRGPVDDGHTACTTWVRTTWARPTQRTQRWNTWVRPTQARRSCPWPTT